MPEPITVSAPGRLCLFGEHQDFLGLPVIACAIDRDITLAAIPRADSFFHVTKPDLGLTDQFAGDQEIPYRHDRDYLRSATNVMLRMGLELTHGYDVTVRGSIPINAGTASSSALVVAWVQFMLAAHNGHLPVTRHDIARLAHMAEVVEFNEPGGMMDHYTSAVGGLLHIECREPITATPLGAHLDGLVLGESLVPKNTTATLRESRRATTTGIDLLREQIPDFSLRATALEQAEDCFHLLPPETRKLVRAQFINRDLCQEAHRMLQDDRFSPPLLGEMLLEHQHQLRDGVGVSHPKLDLMVEAAMEAGALGAKLNGSGMGGAMFAYAPGRQAEVIEALDRVGGRGHSVQVREGVSLKVGD